jgi:phosphoglycolate phosphatase-like HAD superfamily hydrolase
MQPTSPAGGSSYAPLTTERADTPFSKIRAVVNQLRPIIETGYENMLIVRALYEDYQRTGVISASTILGKWSPTYREQLLHDYGTNKDEMVAYFGQTRDDLIAEDLSRWVGLNPVYPSVSACMSRLTSQTVDYTIITTKQERFVRAILETNKIHPPPKEDIYDLENPFGAKVKVLQALIDQHQPKEIHFVEDRYETLLGVMNTPGLERVKMYLVDWGYNTEEQRLASMRLSPRIQLIGGSDFQSLIGQFIVPTPAPVPAPVASRVSDSSQV